MSRSLNLVQIIGHAGNDPDIRSMQDGREIANLSIAATESWKDRNGERQERTEWVRVVVFNEGLVGVVKSYVKKGTQLYVAGKLQTRKWTDKDGIEKYSTEVVLQNFDGKLLLLGGGERSESPERTPVRRGTPQSAPQHADLDDEIPFAWIGAFIACAAAAAHATLPYLDQLPKVIYG